MVHDKFCEDTDLGSGRLRADERGQSARQFCYPHVHIPECNDEYCGGCIPIHPEDTDAACGGERA